MSLRRHHKSLAVQIGLQTPNSKHIRGVQRDKLLFTFTKIPTPKFDEILESSSPPHTHTHSHTQLRSSCVFEFSERCKKRERHGRHSHGTAANANTLHAPMRPAQCTPSSSIRIRIRCAIRNGCCAKSSRRRGCCERTRSSIGKGMW